MDLRRNNDFCLVQH